MNRTPPARRQRLRKPHPSTLAVAVTLALGSASCLQAHADGDALDTVTVTANRRTQNVLDVPYNISTVSGAALENAGVTSLVDIARVLPGVTIPDVGSRANSSNSLIVIRGLNVNDPAGSSYLPWGSVPTVSTYIDDVPLFVNLRFDDIQRVEVLRGPQGTLYGSGAVGGTIKIEHNQPSLRRFSAEASTDISKTDHAGNPSTSTHLMLNVPLSNSVALRFSAAFEQQAGFIDATNATVFGPGQQPVLADPANPVTSGLVSTFLPHIDDSHGSNLRLAGLWQASDTFAARFGYQRQEDRSSGFAHQTAGLSYQTQGLVPQEPEHRTVDLGSLTLTEDMGFATVTSATSYSVSKVSNTYDESQFVVYFDTGAPVLYGHYPRITSLFFSDSRDTAFTQEFRLSSKEGSVWDYTAGLFFQRQAQTLFQRESIPGFAAWSHLPGSADQVNSYLQSSGVSPSNYPNYASYLTGTYGGTDPAALSPTDTNFTYLRNSALTDKALFGELTRHLSEKWQVTGGARLSWQEFDQNLYTTIPYGGPFYSTLPAPANATDISGSTVIDRQQSYHSHTVKLNASYALDPKTRAYATYSEGFRHGGINALPIGNCVFCENNSIVPYKSDTVKNYELGLKGEAGGWLRYSAAVYVIDWNDIQIQTFGQSGDPAVVNGKTARSQGLELELSGRLGGGWSANLGYGFTDAKLTEDFAVTDVVPGAFVPVTTLIAGHSGDALPNVPRQTLTTGIGYVHALEGDMLLDAHLNAAYRSSVVTEVNNSVPGYQHLGGFTTLNGSVGLALGSHWRSRFYVNNITNIRGITSAGQLFRNYADPRYNVEFPSRPRTIGLGVDYTFD